VSYEQFESRVSGLKAQNLGKATAKQYKSGSVFVDHASRYVFLQLHHSTGAVEALQGKLNFERLAKESGVTTKGYRADNGFFFKIRDTKQCQEPRTSTDFQWCRSKSSKWHSRKIHLYTNRKDPYNVAAVHGHIAKTDYNKLLDICNDICSTDPQRNSFRLWTDTIINIYRSERTRQDGHISHFWMPL
jgi:hypothetical protein